MVQDRGSLLQSSGSPVAHISTGCRLAGRRFTHHKNTSTGQQVDPLESVVTLDAIIVNPLLLAWKRTTVIQFNDTPFLS